MAFRNTDACCAVDGEDFSSALKDGCLYSKPETPFQRDLEHIKARRQAILHGPYGANFQDYDEIETINLS